MGTVERIALAVVGVALVTTLLLPGRQTPQVFDAAGRVFTGGIRAAMGR
jgi:hypothetical protein